MCVRCCRAVIWQRARSHARTHTHTHTHTYTHTHTHTHTHARAHAHDINYKSNMLNKNGNWVEVSSRPVCIFSSDFPFVQLESSCQGFRLTDETFRWTSWHDAHKMLTLDALLSFCCYCMALSLTILLCILYHCNHRQHMHLAWPLYHVQRPRWQWRWWWWDDLFVCRVFVVQNVWQLCCSTV